MKDRLIAERCRLCRNLQYLQGEAWAATVCRINRIDDLLAWIDAGRPKVTQEPIRRITLEYAPHEARSLADALECVAQAIRRGAGQ